MTHDLSAGRTALVAWPEAAGLEAVRKAGLDPGSGRGRVIFLGPDGRPYEGAAGRAQALLLRPGTGRLAAAYRVPGWRWLLHQIVGPRAWGVIAASGPNVGRDPCERHGFGRRPDPQAAPTYGRSADLFLHGLAIIHLVAFLSLFVQVRHLIGDQGLLPARDYLAALEKGLARNREMLARAQASTGNQSPSAAEKHALERNIFQLRALLLCAGPFHWIDPGDGGLRAVALAGALLSLGVLLRVFPRLCLALHLWLYLSLTILCQHFLGFQWDNLLLESTFLALLLPMRSRSARSPLSAPRPCLVPHPAVVFLMQWLLFRLYFESGLSKVLAGVKGGWLDLTAMNDYYDTAPLPTWVGWHFHHLPERVHQWESLMTLLVEIILPVFIFAGRPYRRVLLVLFTALQLLILLTGNYAFFNYLSLLLNLFLLDDEDWALLASPCSRLTAGPRRWLGSHFGRAMDGPPPVRLAVPRWRARLATAILVPIAAILFAASLLSFSLFVLAVPDFRAETPRTLVHTLHEVHDLYETFRVVNVYHLFANMTRDRVMVEIEGSDDTLEWKPYRFHYAPGDTRRRPGFVAPHQPRFDFQLWFLAFTTSGVPSSSTRPLSHPYQYWYQTRKQMPLGREYFLVLLQKLLRDPASVSYFFSEMPPFKDGPPRYLRLAFYDYHMSSPETFQKTGEFWTRKLVGYDYALIRRE